MVMLRLIFMLFFLMVCVRVCCFFYIQNSMVWAHSIMQLKMNFERREYQRVSTANQARNKDKTKTKDWPHQI